MAERKYTCANCHKEFEVPFMSSLAARAEAEAVFAGTPEQQMTVVCGACYVKLLPKILRKKKRSHWWSKR